ncbi:MAG: tetratricopeptide repeat protein [Spirochaetaceae bacterium]|jgi:tetratricopeptide (TPR) repeat protein|nr:tetratricopeptide repeat protein [Spirochaetaceae bacterium]
MKKSTGSFVCCAVLSLTASCVTNAISAEEYYSIGAAYFDMGKYEEAERWFTRASSEKKTMNASEYNLGRIAFETGRYSDALRHFEKLIKLDPENVMALKSAAYSEIKLGNLDKAEEYYARVLELEPESTDDGYNHALVLYAMGRYDEAEVVLAKFYVKMPDNKNTLLLLARTYRAEKKVEALDMYALWLVDGNDPLVRYEYARLLEDFEYYARAIEEARKAANAMQSDLDVLKRNEVYWLLARLILIADPENEDAIKELQSAISAGFNDMEALGALAADPRVNAIVKTEINKIIADKQREDLEKKNKAAAAGTSSAAPAP